MPDPDLRDLERAAQADPTPENRARHLVALRRAGELAELPLRVAAVCDDPAALLALGEERVDLHPRVWLSELTGLDRPLPLRAAEIACRLEMACGGVPLVTCASSDVAHMEQHAAVDAVRRLLDDPNEWLAQECLLWADRDTSASLLALYAGAQVAGTLDSRAWHVFLDLTADLGPRNNVRPLRVASSPGAGLLGASLDEIDRHVPRLPGLVARTKSELACWALEGARG